MSLLPKDLLKFKEKGNRTKDWVEKKHVDPMNNQDYLRLLTESVQPGIGQISRAVIGNGNSLPMVWNGTNMQQMYQQSSTLANSTQWRS
jgi:hypothetical protein